MGLLRLLRLLGDFINEVKHDWLINAVAMLRATKAQFHNNKEVSLPLASAQYTAKNAKEPSFKTIDAYIASFPPEVQVVLEALREVIKKAAPGASEKISYGMPTFFLYGNLVHFAMNKKHIGFYPTPSPIEIFSEKLAPYKTSKGAVQFPFGEPLPYDLIREMVEYRVVENMEKSRER